MIMRSWCLDFSITIPFNRPQNTVVQYKFCALFCLMQNEEGREFVSQVGVPWIHEFGSISRGRLGGDDYVIKGQGQLIRSHSILGINDGTETGIPRSP